MQRPVLTGLLMCLTFAYAQNILTNLEFQRVSCVGRCDEDFDSSSMACQCSPECHTLGNCCGDIDRCSPDYASCKGRCSDDIDVNMFCQCHPFCSHFGNCCRDAHICPGLVTLVKTEAP